MLTLQPKIEIKQAYLSWLKMDRNIEQYKWFLDGEYNEKQPCYCNTPTIYQWARVVGFMRTVAVYSA